MCRVEIRIYLQTTNHRIKSSLYYRLFNSVKYRQTMIENIDFAAVAGTGTVVLILSTYNTPKQKCVISM